MYGMAQDDSDEEEDVEATKGDTQAQDGGNKQASDDTVAMFDFDKDDLEWRVDQ
jgi:hypothetical protein